MAKILINEHATPLDFFSEKMGISAEELKALIKGKDQNGINTVIKSAFNKLVMEYHTDRLEAWKIKDSTVTFEDLQGTIQRINDLRDRLATPKKTDIEADQRNAEFVKDVEYNRDHNKNPASIFNETAGGSHEIIFNYDPVNKELYFSNSKFGTAGLNKINQDFLENIGISFALSDVPENRLSNEEKKIRSFRLEVKQLSVKIADLSGDQINKLAEWNCIDKNDYKATGVDENYIKKITERAELIRNLKTDRFTDQKTISDYIEQLGFSKETARTFAEEAVNFESNYGYSISARVFGNAFSEKRSEFLNFITTTDEETLIARTSLLKESNTLHSTSLEYAKIVTEHPTRENLSYNSGKIHQTYAKRDVFYSPDIQGMLATIKTNNGLVSLLTANLGLEKAINDHLNDGDKTRLELNLKRFEAELSGSNDPVKMLESELSLKSDKMKIATAYNSLLQCLGEKNRDRESFSPTSRTQNYLNGLSDDRNDIKKEAESLSASISIIEKYILNYCNYEKQEAHFFSSDSHARPPEEITDLKSITRPFDYQDSNVLGSIRKLVDGRITSSRDVASLAKKISERTEELGNKLAVMKEFAGKEISKDFFRKHWRNPELLHQYSNEGFQAASKTAEALESSYRLSRFNYAHTVAVFEKFGHITEPAPDLRKASNSSRYSEIMNNIRYSNDMDFSSETKIFDKKLETFTNFINEGKARKANLPRYSEIIHFFENNWKDPKVLQQYIDEKSPPGNKASQVNDKPLIEKEDHLKTKNA